MKAVIASKPGGPEVLKIINTEEPEVGVLVELKK